MTEYHYKASGKFNPTCSFSGKWDVSATYTDGSQLFNVASGVPTLSHLDNGLVNYLSFKYKTTAVFSKGQTFSTQFSVTSPDGTLLTSPSVTYQKFGYTVTDGDWTRKGGYFGKLVKELLSEKYGYSDTKFTCDLGSFQVTTWMYQPRGASNVSTVSTVSTIKPSNDVSKPLPATVKSAPEPEDVLDGGNMDIFGNGANTGDY